MNSIPELVSFHTIERSFKELVVSWSFPAISNSSKSMLTKRALIPQDDMSFKYLRASEWLYVQPFQAKTKVKALCVITTDFYPSRYKTLCDILVSKYKETHENPVELVQLYLTVFCNGQLMVQENGSLTTYNFKHFYSPSNVIGIIKGFGLEVILIYTALLLKKRIIVYHNDLSALQKGLLAATKLMCYRHPNDYLYPFLEDLTDIRSKTFFVTGTTNSKLNQNSRYYDLYVNLTDFTITISNHAKETFSLTKSHKDLATFLVQLTENPAVTEKQILLKLEAKTQELLTNLRSLANVKTTDDRKVITVETLKSKKLNQTTENFLFNLAVAENIMML